MRTEEKEENTVVQTQRKLSTHISGIKNIHDRLQRWVSFYLLLLADEFDVPQLSKIEVSLHLHVLNCAI